MSRPLEESRPGSADLRNRTMAGNSERRPLGPSQSRGQASSSPSPVPSTHHTRPLGAQHNVAQLRDIPNISGPSSVVSRAETQDGARRQETASDRSDRQSTVASDYFPRNSTDDRGLLGYGPGSFSLLGSGGGRTGSVSGIAAGARLDLGNLNLVSWKRDVVVPSAAAEEEERSEGLEGEEMMSGEGVNGRRLGVRPRPFHAISQILNHPTRPPDPLRGSRHPLPPLPPNQIQALPRVPEPTFYNTYLESLGMLDAIATPVPGAGSGTPKAKIRSEQEEMGGMVGHGVEGVWEMWRRAVEDEKREREKDDLALDVGSPGGVAQVVPKGGLTADGLALPDLGGIPDLYFSTSFDLADPTAWEQVVGGSGAEPSSHPGRLEIRGKRARNGAASSSSRISMESARSHDVLSQHLDHLESHLVHEISIRTPSFFSALSNLQSLTSQTSSCLTRISSLRTRLQTLDDRTSIKALRIIQRQQELRVRRRVARALAEVESLGNVQRLVAELAEMGDWVGALEGMEEVGRWWTRFSEKGLAVGNPDQDQAGQASTAATRSEIRPPERELHSVREEEEEEEERPVETVQKRIVSSPLDRLPLSQIPALAQVPAELRSLARSIAAQLSTALTSLLTRALDSRPPRPLAGSSDMLLSDADESALRTSFREDVEPLLRGLRRCNAQEAVLDLWRSSVMRSVKEGMRMHLQGETEADEDGSNAEGGPTAKAQPLADALRDMSHERFVTLSDQMYGTMRTRIELARALGAELAAISSEDSSPKTSILSELDEAAHRTLTQPSISPLILQEVLVAACELANARSAKVLVSRTPQHADLSLEQFAAIFEQSWEFISATESTAGRAIVSLRGVISSQARAFLLKYHAKRLQASAKYVEEELWNQVDVPAPLQRQVELIVSSAVADPIGFRLGSQPHTNGHVNGANGTPGEPGKSLEIEGQHFFTVQATSKTVEMLEDYLRLVINFESIATDVMARIVEFLKSFNSRTCQVVLGAGAMRSAGLKNITAKHLALASQSLSIVICLLPYIREFVRRHLSAKQAVMLVEFDKLKRDYQEHQHEIHSKLVAIMSDRLAVHSASVRTVDWENKAGPPRDYATQLVKECTTLHKVLSKYLSNAAVYMIMTQVVDAIRTKIGEEYAKVEFKSDDAKKRMLNDATFIVDKVKDFTDPNMPSPVEGLDDLVRDKVTPKKQVQMGNALNGLLRRGGGGGGGGGKGQPAASAEVLFDGTAPEDDAVGAEIGDESRNSEDRALDDLAMGSQPEPIALRSDEEITGDRAGQPSSDLPVTEVGVPTTAVADPPVELDTMVSEAVVERIADSVAPDIVERIESEAEAVVEQAQRQLEGGEVAEVMTDVNASEGSDGIIEETKGEGVDETSIVPPAERPDE